MAEIKYHKSKYRDAVIFDSYVLSEVFYLVDYRRSMGLSMLRAWMPVEGRYFSG